MESQIGRFRYLFAKEWAPQGVGFDYSALLHQILKTNKVILMFENFFISMSIFGFILAVILIYNWVFPMKLPGDWEGEIEDGSDDEHYN